jgi:lysozyme
MTAPVNDATVDLVKQYEGLRLEAYRCAAGKWTIGYGHTRGVSEGDAITEAEAEVMLAVDITDAAAHVDRLISATLNENQRGALTSFVFNVGSGAFASSTLRRRLNEGNYDAVPSELRRWTRGRHPLTRKPVDLPGLVRRRAAEIELWSR